MIHEILVMLVQENFVGNEDDPILFNNLLHPAEKELVRNILRVPTKYNKILKFIKLVKNDTDFNTSKIGEVEKAVKGLYLKAFAIGLQKALEPYNKKVSELEIKILSNPQLPLSFVYHEIETYDKLFNDFCSMIDSIDSEQLYGCQLIGRVQKYQNLGKENFADSINVIMKYLSVPFFSQLCEWIIYGKITDNYNEFFISDEKCDDPNFSYRQDEDSASSISTSISIVTVLTKTLRIHRPPKIRKFYINWQMVPFFITEEIAETILFIGRIVWILNNQIEDKNHRNLVENRHNVWGDKEIEYWRKIESLQLKSFEFFEVAQIIEECRVKVSKYMLDLFLKTSNIKEHMQLIRDYYTMGRGELFQEFLISAKSYVYDVSEDLDVVNLNFVFLESAKRLYGDEDNSYKKFELVYAKNDVICNYRSGTNKWSWLQLNFEIKWPLHIIFHPQAMQIYNQIFSYLLCFKRTQIHLDNLWYCQVGDKQSIDKRVWTLRHKLMFLVNNLFYYLQVDVIEANFSILQKRLKSATEFEDLINIHHEFISNLAAKTFVLDSDEKNLSQNKQKLFQSPAVHYNVPSKIYRFIMKLLELCDEFSLAAKTWQGELTSPEELQLVDFQKRCDEIVTNLLFSLFNLGKKCGGDHLFQLLDQLNFNQYFVKDSKFNLLSK